jgi:Arm DNA-binding domain
MSAVGVPKTRDFTTKSRPLVSRLTSASVEKRGVGTHMDPAVAGLMLRVRKTSTRCIVREFRFRYTFKRRTGVISLGKFPGLLLAVARARAQRFRDLLQEGIDPRSAMNRPRPRAAVDVPAAEYSHNVADGGSGKLRVEICRMPTVSRLRRAEPRLPGRESVADRPRPAFRPQKIPSPKPPLTGNFSQRHGSRFCVNCRAWPRVAADSAFQTKRLSRGTQPYVCRLIGAHDQGR